MEVGCGYETAILPEGPVVIVKMQARRISKSKGIGLSSSKEALDAQTQAAVDNGLYLMEAS